MIYGLIGEDRDIGYVALTAMEGFSGRRGDADADVRALDRAMEKVLKLFEDVDAVIVDISMNDGGYDTVARALAGRFASERVVGYSKYAGDADEAAPQAVPYRPKQGAPLHRPGLPAHQRLFDERGGGLYHGHEGVAECQARGTENARRTVRPTVEIPAERLEAYLVETRSTWTPKAATGREPAFRHRPRLKCSRLRTWTDGHVEAVREIVRLIRSD